MQTVELAKEKLNAILEQDGFKLHQIQMGQNGRDPMLKIEIDHKKGVSIEDCTKFLEIIDLYLSEKDSEYEKYQIEMSSAGSERALRNIEEVEEAVDRYIYIRTEKRIEKQTDFYGVLTKVENNIITINAMIRGKEKSIEIPYDIIQIIRLAVKF